MKLAPNMKLMLAESDPEIKKLLCERLTRVGIPLESIIPVTSSAQLVTDFRAESAGIAAVIVHSSLRNKSSVDAVRMIREQSPEVPIIVISGGNAEGFTDVGATEILEVTKAPTLLAAVLFGLGVIEEGYNIPH
ncbi:MAG: hypothetical protein PHV93_00270 [Candidatus Pacebacteria bacterium]|nr:hypothetical protein [Candidatus Paceibacterota bacterium]